MSRILTVTLLVAACLTLIHWHQDLAGQRCEICFARDLPSIYTPVVVALDAPTRIEWHSPAEQPLSTGSDYFQLSSSRGPPRLSSL